MTRCPDASAIRPIIGAGCWADQRAAVSCTGLGEYFMRTNAAADVSARIAYAGASLADAADAALADVKSLGGDGGLIAVDAQGHVATPFVSQGMKRAIATSGGVREVEPSGDPNEEFSPRLLSHSCSHLARLPGRAARPTASIGVASGGAAFSARINAQGAAEVFAGGQVYTLPGVVAGSGTRYTNGAVEYWEHGGEATLNGAQGGPYTGCRRS